MLKHLVRAALLGLRRQSTIPIFTKTPWKSGGTFVSCLSCLLFGIVSTGTCKAQCSAIASKPQYASDCAARGDSVEGLPRLTRLIRIPFRNQVGRTIVELRNLKDAVLYKFGVDHERQKTAAESIFQLERKQDQDLAAHPSLGAVRAHLASGLDALAEAVGSRLPLAPFADPVPNVPTRQPREAAYARTITSRYRDLHSLLTSLSRDV